MRTYSENREEIRYETKSFVDISNVLSHVAFIRDDTLTTGWLFYWFDQATALAYESEKRLPIKRLPCHSLICLIYTGFVVR